MRIVPLILSVLMSIPGRASAAGCGVELSTSRPTVDASPSVDPARLVVTSSPRDPLVRGLIANVVATLGQFPDPSLVHQIIEHQPRERWTFDAEDLAIVAVDQPLVDAVRAWVTTLAELGPLDRSAWQTIVTALHASDLTVYLNTAAQAVILDGAFAPFEGDSSVMTALEHEPWLREVEARASRLTRDARSTPFGVPTDDSQFLVGGASVALVSAESFADDLLSHWRALNGEGLWRNAGRRFKSWLGGDDRALAGPTMLGDLLRLIAVLPQTLGGGVTGEGDLDRLTKRLHWSAEKLTIARTFVAFQRARLNRDRPAATTELERLIAWTTAEDTKTSEFLSIARAHLWRRTDLRAFLTAANRVGRDYDTYAFLAPFFADECVLAPADYRALGPHVRPYVAAIVASALARAGAVPIETALRTHYAFLDHERVLRDQLRSLRR